VIGKMPFVFMDVAAVEIKGKTEDEQDGLKHENIDKKCIYGRFV
jgi:hypothetical protein